MFVFFFYLKGDDNFYLPHDASIENLTAIQNQISIRREEVLKKLANESTIYNGCNINLTNQIPSLSNTSNEMSFQVSKQINLISLETIFFEALNSFKSWRMYYASIHYYIFVLYLVTALGFQAVCYLLTTDLIQFFIFLNHKVGSKCNTIGFRILEGKGRINNIHWLNPSWRYL